MSAWGDTMETADNCFARYFCQIKNIINELTIRHSTASEKVPLIAFRGEPKDYAETKLTPSLFREQGYIEKEEHLFELFCDYKIVSNSASNIEKAIETQHYASISRMLDISFDVLVAFYFACTQQEDHDGFIYVFAFPERYSPHSKYIEELYSDVLNGRHTAYPRNFKVFSHSRSNDRINAQRGGFIFFPGKEFYPISNCYYDRILIAKEDKPAIRTDLSLLFQVNESTLFPEKDKVAAAIIEKFKSSGYSPEEVSVQTEIETFFHRVDYELQMRRACGKAEEKKDVLRWLRKEEDDLTQYARFQKVDEASVKEISRNFEILRLRY